MKPPLIITPIIKKRTILIIIIILPVFFIFLNVIGLFVWQCPFHTVTSFDCPGCGMTRAITALIKLHYKEAFHYHPFSFLLVMGWVCLLIIYCLPSKLRTSIIQFIEKIESKTAFVLFFIGAFIIYGTVRLILEIINTLQ